MKKTFLTLLVFVSLFFTGSIVFPFLSHATLIAYYPFEGNANDASGNSYDGTVSGATLTGGYYGQAYSFDGVNDHISANVNLGYLTMPKVTMGAWAKLVSGAPNNVFQVISHDEGGFDRSLSIDWRGGGWGWSAHTGLTNQVVGFVTPTLNEWAFIAVVYDQTVPNALLYVNGTTFTEATSFDDQGLPYIWIGDNPTWGPQVFNGVIDEVFIFNEALTVAQLDNIRQNGVMPLAPIPEPSTLLLLGTGLAGLYRLRRKRASRI